MKEIKVDTEKEKKQELQQKLIVYQILQRHIEELQQQAMLLERRFAELESALRTISDVEKVKKGGEVLFPLGGGIYSKGSSVDSRSFMVDLGSGFVAKKSAADAKAFLEKKKEEIERLGENMQAEMKATVSKLNVAANELKELAGQ